MGLCMYDLDEDARILVGRANSLAVNDLGLHTMAPLHVVFAAMCESKAFADVAAQCGLSSTRLWAWLKSRPDVRDDEVDLSDCAGRHAPASVTPVGVLRQLLRDCSGMRQELAACGANVVRLENEIERTCLWARDVGGAPPPPPESNRTSYVIEGSNPSDE